jgi:hypothetical protein
MFIKVVRYCLRIQHRAIETSPKVGACNSGHVKITEPCDSDGNVYLSSRIASAKLRPLAIRVLIKIANYKSASVRNLMKN